MKSHSLFILFLLVLSATVCAKPQITLTKGNITGYTTADVIAYLQEYKQQLNSDSLVQTFVEKEKIIKEIRDLVGAMEKGDSTSNISQYDISSGEILSYIPHLDSVLTQAIKYLKKKRGTDYLNLMDANWDNFTIYGPMAQTLNNLNMLLVAYLPFYWERYAGMEKDIIAYYTAFLKKLDEIHYSARSVSQMHRPPMPFPAYIYSTQIGMHCLEEMGKYEDALNRANTYLEDMGNWGYYYLWQFDELDAADSHFDIMVQMRECHKAMGDSVIVTNMDKFLSSYPSTMER